MPSQDPVPSQQNVSGTAITTANRVEAGYEFLFDSFVQSVRKGIRSSVVSARQLLFRIGAVFVDVEIGCEVDSGRASLIGQMLDSSNPGHPPAKVQIALLNHGRNIATTFSNDNGEFQFQFVMKSHLELSVAVNHRSPVYLPISDSPTKTVARAKRTATRTLATAGAI